MIHKGRKEDDGSRYNLILSYIYQGRLYSKRLIPVDCKNKFCHNYYTILPQAICRLNAISISAISIVKLNTGCRFKTSPKHPMLSLLIVPVSLSTLSVRFHDQLAEGTPHLKMLLGPGVPDVRRGSDNPS